jgi:hypothetical protein
LVSHTAVTFLSGDFTPKYGGCLNRLAVATTGSGLRSRQFVLSVPVAGLRAPMVLPRFRCRSDFCLFVFARPNFAIKMKRRIFANSKLFG